MFFLDLLCLPNLVIWSYASCSNLEAVYAFFLLYSIYSPCCRPGNPFVTNMWDRSDPIIFCNGLRSSHFLGDCRYNNRVNNILGVARIKHKELLISNTLAGECNIGLVLIILALGVNLDWVSLDTMLLAFRTNNNDPAIILSFCYLLNCDVVLLDLGTCLWSMTWRAGGSCKFLLKIMRRGFLLRSS
jgi:hypothetical protein